MVMLTRQFSVRLFGDYHPTKRIELILLKRTPAILRESTIYLYTSRFCIYSSINLAGLERTWYTFQLDDNKTEEFISAEGSGKQEFQKYLK